MRRPRAKKAKAQKKNQEEAKDVEEEVVPEVTSPITEDNENNKDAQEQIDSNDADVEMGVESNDDAVVEEPIAREEPTIPSQLKIGQIPAGYPHEQVVHVNKLPKSCKMLDVVEIFAKYGPIDMIHFHQGPVDSIANVAFKTPSAATAALGAHKQITLDGSTILVTMKRATKKKPKAGLTDDDQRERCIYVRHLKRGTTEDQLREHFASYGEIENVRVVAKNAIHFGFVTFVAKESVDKALELHNTLLNGVNIGVFRNKTTDASDRMEGRDPELTVILRNKQELESVDGQKLETIFTKCGEITNMDVLCKKKVLAFITFKSKESRLKALELDGQELEGIDIQIEPYTHPDELKKSIFIINVAQDVTVDDMKAHFSKAGEISAVILRKGFAIIHFAETDGYCKSFLLNETVLKGQMIFLEPYSLKKQNVMKGKSNFGQRKRFAPNGKASNATKRSKLM